MIRFFLGKPGGGKSLYATREIIRELAGTRRLIVTNLALRLPELAAYCEAEQIDYGLHINERVFLLADEWLKGFFCFRRKRLPLVLRGRKGAEDVPDADLEHLTDAQAQLLERGDLVVEKCDYRSSYGDGGILYVLDEAHIAFSSRAWQQTGQAVLYYLSQHRKLSDDVIVITQSANLIDRQFRSVCQDFTTIRNHSKEKFGFFRAPSVFTRRTYLHPPTGAPGDRAIETKHFTLDVRGTATVYDTASGIGIHGANADKGQRASGLPWWLFVFGGAIAVYLMLRVAPSVFAMPFRIHENNHPKQILQSAQKIEPTNTVFTLQPIPPAPRVNTNVSVTGYMKLGSHTVVCFSDGTTAAANSVTDFSPGIIYVDGVLFRIISPNEQGVIKHGRRDAGGSGY